MPDLKNRIMRKITTNVQSVHGAKQKGVANKLIQSEKGKKVIDDQKSVPGFLKVPLTL